ncbi:uncharacterized protein LOC128267782 [Anopheles cruzii]|uniref:uncharacterized protein LOC128267782 n=1 Tax=Anopheles cruzii TaxID=68878 RepID=UPI0022EC394B|nr:uncharacterized protein LOC128267782 [Anopheles cruzii]
MMLYNIISSLQWWCIFILYTQHASECASFFSNAEPAGISAAGLLPSLCGDSSESSEQYVSDKGAASSVVLSLRPEHGRGSPSSCKRQFRAPDAYSFFVRLQRVPGNAGSRGAPSRKYSNSKSSNTTDSCSLTISQSANGEVLPSWRLDPCALEASGAGDDQMRLLQGKLNIVWNHDGNAPNYRLQITVVGQGTVCLEKEKHSCLDYVGMPLLCVARELICDGVPNCPPLGSDVSDENEMMCAKHRLEEYSANPVQSVFRKYIQNTLKSFFGGEPDELPSGEVADSLSDQFAVRFPPQPTSSSSPSQPAAATSTTETTVPAKKHRNSLTGLSKYGPWGYLFLGMLICGGALLICGLWECCCRSHKPEHSPDDSLPDAVPSFLQTSPSPTDANGRIMTQTGPIPSLNLPHYGELDPPPAYSVLFPNQKPSDDGTESERPTVVTSSEEPTMLTVADGHSGTVGSNISSNSNVTSDSRDDGALETASPQQQTEPSVPHSSSSQA